MCDDSRSDRDPFERKLSENGSIAGGEQYQNKIEVNLHTFDEQFWLKKFRYALREGDQGTQRKLQQQFGPIVIQLIENHPQAKAACGLHDKEYYITETFRRFWSSSFKHQKFGMKSLLDIFSYLHNCLNGIILETLRQSSCPQNVSYANVAVVIGPEQNDIDRMRKGIESKLSNERERRVAFLLFQCALKPREIIDNYPDEFSDAREISHIRRNIMGQFNDGDHTCLTLDKIP